MLLQLNRSLFLVPFLALALLSAGIGSLSAQERTDTLNSQRETVPAVTPSATNPLPPVSAEAPVPLVQPRFGDMLFLRGKNGELHPVLESEYADLAEFLKWKQKQSLPPVQPAYSFSNVTFEGSATEDKASLKATLTIQITKGEEWVNVPLELEEATLTKCLHEYKPPAQTAERDGVGKSAFDRQDQRGRLWWWFYGEGQHILTLEMLVPIRKTNGVRRLQLAVPSAASSYLSLKLPVPSEQLSLETLLAGAHKTTASGKDSTIVELFRLGQRLDLGWRALPDSRQVKTLLKAESELRIEPTEESILLKARQLIEPLQGSMNEIEVSLPGGFTVLELKVDGERYPPLEDFSNSPEPLKIALPAATTSRVRLDWILQAPWPTSGQLIVEGFNVSECLRQSGEIGVAGFEGYRIAKRSATVVYRTNVPELLGPGPNQTAYQFLQQPFQLVLDFQKIEPTFSARPHLFVKMGAKQIDLLAELELEVYRGVLETLEIDWPRFAEEGWTIDRTELPGVVEDIELDQETGRIRLPLAKRLSPGTVYRFPIRAMRKIVGPGAFPLTLPRLIASNPARTVVVVTNQENVESTVSPMEGTETQPLSANLAEDVESLLNQPGMRDIRGTRQTGFLVRSDAQSFQAKLITHPQTITSETEVKVESIDGRMQVEQRLRYDVKYEPVSQLRVLVPRTFPENAVFSLGTVPLSFEWTGFEGNSRRARLALPKPELDRFEITARYEVSEKDRRDHQLEIPCVRAADADEVKGRLEFSTDYPSQVTVEGSNWMRVPDRETQNVWTTASLGETLRVNWSPRNESDIQRFTIGRALVRTAIQPNGQILCRADYQPQQALTHLLISLPPDKILRDAFSWNGEELTESQVHEVEPGTGTFRLSLPSNGREENSNAASDRPVLSVTYRMGKPTALEWSQDFDLATPTFPGEVWIEKTLWEVALPVDQHLFTLPEGFTPEFSWTWQGLFWARSSAEEPNDWFGRNREMEFPLEGNTYRFSYFGPCSTLAFTSMNRSIIVLFGAGLSMLAGFLLLKIPFTRNVLTVLVLAFAFALCSVWYKAPIQILLQPACLGLLLAIIAVLLDTFFKRQRQANVLTLPGPGEYGSSVTQPARSYSDVIGSEDPTAVRPIRPSASDSQATRQRTPYQEDSQESPPALIGSSITEKPE